MRSIMNVVLLVTGVLVLVTACEKPSALPSYKLGNPVYLTATVGGVVSSSPSVSPTPTDSTKTVLTLNWTFPNYATDSANMKYIVEIDTTGRNFAKEVTRTMSKSLSTTFTGRDLNAILLNYGSKAGTTATMDMRVTSSYSNNNEQYRSNVIQVKIKSYVDSPKLVSEKTSVICSIATATQHSNTFSWSPTFPGYTGNITYTLLYDSVGKGFRTPASIPVGINLYSKDLSQSEMNTTAIASGITGGTTGKVEYKLRAVTAGGDTAFSNVVNVTITSYVVALYVVGDSSPAGWTPSAAIPMISDSRFPGTFFAYIKLTTSGYGIKFLSENTDWNSPTLVVYGDVNASGNTGNLTSTGGGQNVIVPANGTYRVTVDLSTLKYYLQTGGIGAVGLVGAFQTPTQWDPPTAIKMANVVPNKFVFLTNMTQNDEFKFHDGNTWDNSANNKSRWYDLNSSNKIIIDGTGSGGNFKWSGTTGRVRAIFDYSVVSNPRWSLSEANGMWVIGTGTTGGWDNLSTQTDADRPPLTYMGNGVWQATVTLLSGEIKFIVKKGNWDFSYGGSSGKLVYDNGPNIAVTAGTYTITIDEYTGAYTIL